MKKYERPTMRVEKFEANEFCSSCGEHVKYLFECNAGIVNGKAQEAEIWLDKNNNGRLDNNDKLLSKEDLYFKACGKTHAAPREADFPKGFIMLGKGSEVPKKGQEGVIPVRLWIQTDKHVHATEQLDMNKWQTNKS